MRGGLHKERIMIELLTAPTPNGWKVSIALELLELEYTSRYIKLAEGEQRQDWFLELNPAGKIPVLRDGDFTMTESSAMLLYLAEKTGQLLPTEPKARAKVLQWLMFQTSALGPSQGTTHVFYRYLPKKNQEMIDRFQAQTLYTYSMLNKALENSEFLSGEMSIADLACWPWVTIHHWPGLTLDEFPHLSRWNEQLKAIPAFQKGLKIPVEIDFEDAEAYVNKARKLMSLPK